jgi:hypothetical protein
MIHIGVIRGGQFESEKNADAFYAESLETGRSIIDSIDDTRYRAHDIFIDKNGVWHKRGIPVLPSDALSGIDLIFLAHHAHDPHHTHVLRTLEKHGMRTVGSSADATHMSGMHTHPQVYSILKPKLSYTSLPRTALFNGESAASPRATAEKIFVQFGPPYILESNGIQKHVRTFSQLIHALDELHNEFQQVARVSPITVSQAVSGKRVYSGIIDSFRNEDAYALPVVDHIIEKSPYPDLVHNEQHHLQYPSDLPIDVRKRIEHAAREIHNALGLSGYSLIEFLVTPTALYIHNIEPRPKLEPGAPFMHALEVVGVTRPQLLDHLFALTLKK